MNKTMRIIKDNLLVCSAIIALMLLVIQVNDPTPLGDAREIFTTVICTAWLSIFGYAQLR